MSDPQLPADQLEGRRLLHVPSGGTLRDRAGRDVILRGVNVGGRSKTPPYMPFVSGGETAGLAHEARRFLEPVVAWGFDTLRVPFVWEAVEPSAGQFSDLAFQQLAALLDAAHELRLSVILDLHQDIYSSVFGGDGFPAWTVTAADSVEPGLQVGHWSLAYLHDPRVRRAFGRFWRNEDGLLDAFLRMWAEVCRRLGSKPALIGVEVLNEPGWDDRLPLSRFKREVLQPFFTDMLDFFAERLPHALVLCGSPGVDAVAGVIPHYAPDPRPSLVYAPHLYDPGLVLGGPRAGPDPAIALSDLARFGREHGAHIFVGEFGVGHGGAGGQRWMSEVLSALDRHRFSGTVWEYSNPPAPWNGEDFSLVGPDGEPRPLVDAVARPWPRAVAGTNPSFHWDDVRRVGEAHWIADGGTSQLMFPPRTFPSGPEGLLVSGAGARVEGFDPRRGLLSVAAPAGVTVHVDFG